MKNLTYEQALQRLAAYCSRTERCVSDIRRKMLVWDISGDEQNRIIQRLTQEKFLDESRYCRAFVNDKFKYSRWGIYKIKYELKKKQIPAHLIAEALEGIDSEENQELLHQLLSQKMKVVKGRNGYEVKQKLMRFALGRGFSPDEIEKALSSIGHAQWNADDETG
jgi:regulatory protein